MMMENRSKCNEDGWIVTQTVSDLEDESNSDRNNIKIRSQNVRNISEKKRRDKLNTYINQLASLLPSKSHQRMDKCSILSQTLKYLKKQNKVAPGKLTKLGSSKCFLSSEDITTLMIQAIHGFILTVGEDGKINHVSKMAEVLLGMEYQKFLGQPLVSVIHSEDAEIVLHNINSALSQSLDRERSGVLLAEDTENICFQLLFRLSQNISNETSRKTQVSKLNCYASWKQAHIRSPGCNEVKGNILTMLLWPDTNLQIENQTQTMNAASFSARLSMDGRFQFMDSSCSDVTGYLSSEMLKVSIYFYVNECDLEDVAEVHKKLINSTDVGSLLSFFRFRSKSGNYLLLKTIIGVTFNPLTSKAEYINANFSFPTPEEIFQYYKRKSHSPESASNETSTPMDGSVAGNARQMLSYLVKRKQSEKVKSMPMEASNDASLVQQDAEIPSNLFRKDDYDEKSSISRKDLASISDEPRTATSSSIENANADGKQMECDLQVQLKRKLEILSDSIKRQKKQLNKIMESIENVPRGIRISEWMPQREQKRKICGQLENTIKDQERQCYKLKVILDSKIKIFETKRRAVELRGKSKRRKTPAENRESYTVSRKGNGIINPPASYSQNHQLKSDGLLHPSNSCPGLSSRMHESEVEDRVKKTLYCVDDGDRGLHGIQRECENHEQQSLQRQLEKLQQQQDILNAQGMALATRGNLSQSQVDSLQTLLMQQNQSIAHESHNQQKRNNPQMQSGFQPNKSMDNLQQSNYQMNGKQKFRPSKSISDFQLESSIESNSSQILKPDDFSNLGQLVQPDSTQSSEILSQLQMMQTQLQVQMQILNGQQQQQNPGEHTESLTNIVLALQQLQQLQLNLLQRRLKPPDACDSPQSIPLRQSNDFLKQCITPSQSPLPCSIASPQQPFSPTYDNNMTSYPSKAVHRSGMIDQGLSPPYYISQSPKQPAHSPHYGSIPSTSQASGSRFDFLPDRRQTTGNSVSQTFSVSEPDFYQSCSTADTEDQFLGFSPAATDSNLNHQRSQLFDSQHKQQEDARSSKSSAEKKDPKKLDDGLDDFIQTLPGQTQQLMQLHHAQRMHIVKMQHQQLQALQSLQQAQQQPPLPQQSIDSSQQPFVANFSEGSGNTSYAQSTSQLGYDQSDHDATPGTSHQQMHLVGGSADNNWQNDLHSDQVASMNDCDLLELLNGNHVLDFDEKDEQVLDLLIAEGGDLFSF